MFRIKEREMVMGGFISPSHILLSSASGFACADVDLKERKVLELEGKDSILDLLGQRILSGFQGSSESELRQFLGGAR